MSKSILNAPTEAKDALFFLGIMDELERNGQVVGQGHFRITDDGRKQYEVLRKVGHKLTDDRIRALIGIFSDGVADDREDFE